MEVIDLLPAYLEARAEPGDDLYLAQDTHWTDRGLRMAAELIAARIKRFPWYAGLEKVELTSEKLHFQEEGDLLLAEEAAIRLEGAEGLGDALGRLAASPQERAALGSRALAVTARLRGATGRHLGWIRRHLQLYLPYRAC